MVNVLTLLSFNIRLKVRQDWCEMSWTCKENPRRYIFVLRYDSFCTIDCWIIRITIQREVVLDGIDTQVPWNSAKTKDGKVLINTVILYVGKDFF